MPSEIRDKKPGNRGKRDSQLILMNFFSRVTYNDRMSPLDFDIFRKVQVLMGVTPDFFEVVLMVSLFFLALTRWLVEFTLLLLPHVPFFPLFPFRLPPYLILGRPRWRPGRRRYQDLPRLPPNASQLYASRQHGHGRLWRDSNSQQTSILGHRYPSIRILHISSSR